MLVNSQCAVAQARAPPLAGQGWMVQGVPVPGVPGFAEGDVSAQDAAAEQGLVTLLLGGGKRC